VRIATRPSELYQQKESSSSATSSNISSSIEAVDPEIAHA
jgi:hypothetical protein